jgi:hypothetical protein
VGQLTPLIAGKLVAFDTGTLIYYIEEQPNYLSPVESDSYSVCGQETPQCLNEP